MCGYRAISLYQKPLQLTPLERWEASCRGKWVGTDNDPHYNSACHLIFKKAAGCQHSNGSVAVPSIAPRKRPSGTSNVQSRQDVTADVGPFLPNATTVRHDEYNTVLHLYHKCFKRHAFLSSSHVLEIVVVVVFAYTYSEVVVSR